MSGADDLFTGDAPPPPTNRLPRIRRILLVALPLDLLGIPCFTGVPGAILTLWAWQLADEELARVESGALPVALRPDVVRIRAQAFGLLVFVLLSLVAQMILYSWILKGGAA